ncbi:hypothetical protein [Mycoplasma elephantis]|uniref:hypothetical protein n=1 Tax=Mycoplasma elephantis TaxID=114882 RepID=UPI00146F94CA|nr:hypothetical protein [Mycoplasma elephantis]
MAFFVYHLTTTNFDNNIKTVKVEKKRSNGLEFASSVTDQEKDDIKKINDVWINNLGLFLIEVNVLKKDKYKGWVDNTKKYFICDGLNATKKIGKQLLDGDCLEINPDNVVSQDFKSLRDNIFPNYKYSIDFVKKTDFQFLTIDTKEEKYDNVISFYDVNININRKDANKTKISSIKNMIPCLRVSQYGRTICYEYYKNLNYFGPKKPRIDIYWENAGFENQLKEIKNIKNFITNKLKNMVESYFKANLDVDSNYDFSGGEWFIDHSSELISKKSENKKTAFIWEGGEYPNYPSNRYFELDTHFLYDVRNF